MEGRLLRQCYENGEGGWQFGEQQAGGNVLKQKLRIGGKQMAEVMLRWMGRGVCSMGSNGRGGKCLIAGRMVLRFAS